MRSSIPPDIVISGMGVTSSIGQGKDAFLHALLEGAHRFDVMRRPGRQRDSRFLGAEIAAVCLPGSISQHSLRTASFSAQVALATLAEAWSEAKLDDVDPARVGLIVGGSNFQQRELTQAHDVHTDRPRFLRPTYGMSFMDTDLCGLCTEQFGIGGLAHTVGGASASGQLAVMQAVHAVHAAQVDVCIALGALMDLSYWECQGLRALGAMGSDRFANEPQLACRPFDRGSDGFIYGECCGVVVVESADTAIQRGLTPTAIVSGSGCVMDRNRNPNPSMQGEAAAIRKALQAGGCVAAEIDYINPHGSGSPIGDETELAALRASGLAHACINATKSMTGHGLTAAGAVEVVATVLQMKSGYVHPTRNLEDPVNDEWNWVRTTARRHRIENALTLSMGFGGINTALCLRRYS